MNGRALRAVVLVNKRSAKKMSLGGVYVWSRPFQPVHERLKERSRQEKQKEKAERKVQRRAEKPAGGCDELTPEDFAAAAEQWAYRRIQH